MLERLNKVNDVPVYSVFDEKFLSYGRVLEGYDFSEIIGYMQKNTEIPDNGNIYVPGVDEMKNTEIRKTVENTLYGSMPVQIGYCNGRNTTYNGFEYHKAPEINVAVTDFMLCLGHSWDIKDNSYRIEQAEVFYVPQGTAIEMFGTTLHLSPLRTCDSGFKDIVILPEGTNTPLEEKCESTDPESKLLLMKNKWVIAHPDREPLIKQGAYAGVIGENKELYY
ncbi:MAG: DUF4867 family protein [Ruminococcaceae bacterium]|nr:DUF4867 family protein [Oscillospiraceae bacterium]